MGRLAQCRPGLARRCSWPPAWQRWAAQRTNGDERIACVLTGHLLKDPNVIVNYHKGRQGPLSNPPIEAPNDLEAIIKLIR